MRRTGPLQQIFSKSYGQLNTGSDLFALLFLVMLMLAQIFMIMAHDAVPGQGKKPIDGAGQGSDGIEAPKKQPPVGKIIQKGKRILIEFDGRQFDPARDGARLITSGYTAAVKDESGREVQVLYVNYEGVIDSKTLSQGLSPLKSLGIVPLFPE